jgi:hypothetical protein
MMYEERWIPLPTVCRKFRKSYCYQWHGLEIKRTSKGYGVYVTADENPNLLLPYGGRFTNHLKLKSLEALCAKRRSYIAVCKRNNVNEPIGYYDSHPIMYPIGKPKFGWIGSLINSPSAGETANAILRIRNTDLGDVPKYPLIQKNPIVVIEITKQLKAGDEILIDYNWTTHEMLALLNLKQTKVMDFTYARSVWKYCGKHCSKIKKQRTDENKKKGLLLTTLKLKKKLDA